MQRQVAMASSVALAAATAVGLTLPASFFQASAIVAVDEPSAALRIAAARSAADLAVSKPVIVRAATSLNGTAGTAPAPALAEKLAVATGFAGATGAVARLAEALVPKVGAHAGDGFVEVQALATDAARAAQVATALAEALVAEEEGLVLARARQHDLSTATHLETLREAAHAAHARLAALGASDSDPVEALAAAGTATRSAETRLAAVRAVIAAGTPPLGAGSDLPASAAALQQTYWDLKKQLDKASESMGERHTTVIALRDGVSRAAAALTAEWQRIERAAASDVTTTRSREAVLRRSATIADPVKRTAVEAARGAARLADAALARAAAVPAAAALAGPSFRLVAPVAVPAAASGLGPWQRDAASGGAGIGAFALAWLLARRRRASGTAQFEDASISSSTHAGRTSKISADALFARDMKALMHPVRLGDPLAAVDKPVFVAAAERRIPVDVVEASAIERTDDHDQLDYDCFALDWPNYDVEIDAEERSVGMPSDAASFDAEAGSSDVPHKAPIALHALADLRDALGAITAGHNRLTSGRMASVMVASNASGADTGAVALALGEAAAELGYRVLVIGGERALPTLAEAVASNGDPLLVDAFGALRVAFPAERHGGLFLAPALRDGVRVAAELARYSQAKCVDDLSAAFDAVVIDGGRAADSAALGWNADALIRVGRFASMKDDADLLAAFDAPEEALLGTVVAGRFVAREVPRVSELELEPTPRPSRPVLATSGGQSSRRSAPPVSKVSSAPRRRVGAR